ncbi:hypothetical protein GT360_06540 [Vibrio astriarenae]|uniref:Lipoprotein n=1 Tax=Vibrio astriarenae TaxID=1481923 RepID=A0A7Z2T2Q3_9VIBR|nr:MalM family protein [Vibrio astriarenae]QIA63192.1 hypothetical protein GT360_06540 [Vibrio astriarenae]
MREKLIIGAILAGVVGCSNITNMFEEPEYTRQESNRTIESMLELQALPLQPEAVEEIEITRQSQYLDAYGIQSPVAVYKVETDAEQIKLTLKSYLGKTVYAPSYKVIDLKGNVVFDAHNHDFSVIPSSLTDSYRQEIESDILLPSASSPYFVVVYTSEDDLEGKTEVTLRPNTNKEETMYVEHDSVGIISAEFTLSGTKRSVVHSQTTSKDEELREQLRASIESGDVDAALDLVDQL